MDKQIETWRKLDAGVSIHEVDDMEHTRLRRKIRDLQLNDEAHAVRISKLKAAVKRQANAFKSQLRSEREKSRKSIDELQAVENAFIQGLENHRAGESHGESDVVFPKAMGVFDPSQEWYDHVWAYYATDENCGTQVKEFINFWEARVREPDFDASIREEGEDGILKYTINGDHEELNEVLENYGPEVYEAVCDAHLQVRAYGDGTVLWHYGENRKATVSEVLERWSLSFERIKKPVQST